MICKYCGEVLEDNSTFCTSCGKKQDEVLLSDFGQDVSYSDESGESAGTSVLGADSEDLSVNDSPELTDAGSADIPEEFTYDNTASDFSGVKTNGTSVLETDLYPELSAQNDKAQNGAEFAGYVNNAGFQGGYVPADNAQAGFAAYNVKKNPAGGKTSLAIIILSAALFALAAFLFVDKLFLSNADTLRNSSIMIVSQPKDIVVREGAKVTFFVEANGDNLSYQWYYRKSGDKNWHVWNKHNQAKTNAIANNSWNDMQVYCTITDNNRTTVATDIVNITIEKNK